MLGYRTCKASRKALQQVLKLQEGRDAWKRQRNAHQCWCQIPAADAARRAPWMKCACECIQLHT